MRTDALWVVALAPLAVLGIVASSVGQKEGMKVFLSLIWLIVVVVVGLGCRVTWYWLQIDHSGCLRGRRWHTLRQFRHAPLDYSPRCVFPPRRFPSCSPSIGFSTAAGPHPTSSAT